MVLFLKRIILATYIVFVFDIDFLRCEDQELDIDKNSDERMTDDFDKSCPIVNSEYPSILSHPQDCNKFYICDSGSRYLKVCPTGLYFNPVIKACDYPERVNCDKNEIERPKGRMIGDKSSLCPAENSKIPILIPHSDDCSKFYICDGGSAHLKECHPGLHFNAKLKACDYPQKAGCDAAFKELPKDKQIGEDSNLCPAENSKYPILLPHPDDCSKFYICDSGLAHLKECQSGLHFNPKINTCDYPRNAKCSAGKQVALSGVPSPYCPPINGKTPIFFPHSTNCSVYYMCGNGFAYEFVCPARLHFNLRKQVCDYEWNSGCQNRRQ